MAGVVWLVIMVITALLNCNVVRCSQPGGTDRYYSNVIATTHGLVQGQTENVPNGRGQQVEVDAIWGIPFAKPPVGDLRFRRPVPRDAWDGVLQATTPPNSCYQVLRPDPVIIPNPPTQLSEDCLYLNVWRPRCGCRCSYDKSGGRSNGTGCGLTTMVWIHGGLFTTGSSTVSLYNGAKLASSECVIVVTVNYRLGALGFMSLGIKENPGNMGLLDMTLALKWVKSNAENFGGTQEKITVFGDSAGGVSSSLFLLSPLTRDLVTNVISQSGNPSAVFAYQTTSLALKAALKFSRMFNCCSANKSLTVACLKQVDAAALTAGHLRLIQGLTTLMNPVVDGYFLTQLPTEAFISGDFKRTSILTGTTAHEGTIIMNILWPDQYNFRSLKSPQPLTDQELDEKLTQSFGIFLKPEFIPRVVADIKVIYQLDKLRQQVPDVTFTLLRDVISDAFRCSALFQADVFANTSQDVYLYSFNHYPDISPLPNWVGATHTLDIPFVFGNNVPDIPAFSHREVKLVKTMMSMWANFAKYGNPTPHKQDNPKWPTYSRTKPANLLIFTESAEVQVGRTEVRRCDYWNGLPRIYYRD